MILAIVLFILPVSYVAGQSSFTTYVGAVRTYHIDNQPNITSYNWQVFTDASLTLLAAPADVTLTLLGAGHEHEVQVAWNATGTYYLVIAVVDNTGCTNRMAWEFSITANQPPVLADDSNSTIETLTVDEGDGSGNLLVNDVDPEGGTLVISSIDGDNSGAVSGTFGVLSWNSDGTYSYSPNAQLDSLTASESVLETFSVTVTDDQGLSSVSTLTITISGENDLPLLTDDTNATVELLPVDESDGSGNLLANDLDTDGDLLSITSIGGDVTGTISGTFGTLVWNTNGTYTYSPNPGLDSLAATETVTEVFSVTVSDGNGGNNISTLTIAISGENDVPVLVNDTNNTIKSTPIDETDGSGSLLSNDVDIDGDLLQVISINGDLTGTISDGYGVLEWRADGTYSFTPSSLLDTLAQGESVVITYNYTASDVNGGSSVASLTITILGANSNPLAIDDTNSTIEAISVDEADGSGNLLANDTDAENDQLSIESIEGDYSGIVVGIYGTLQWNIDGSYTYTPNSELDSLFSGEVISEVFDVTIEDILGGTDNSLLTITITGENDLPIAMDDSNETIEIISIDELDGSGNLLSNDTDLDGDILLITSISGNISGAVSGTYGMLVWHTDGTYTYTPNTELDSLGAGESAVDNFLITISDGHGGTDVSELNITINGSNQLPVANNDTNFTTETVAVDQSHGSGNILSNDTDADGDVLIIASVNGFSSGAIVGTYGTLSWSHNGNYTYTPNTGLDSLAAGEIVTEIFTLVISDGHGGTDTSTLTIAINGENDVPVVLADTNSTIETNQVNETDGSGNLLANDSDPDGNTLFIESINGNVSGTVLGIYGLLTWNPDGTYSYTPNAALDSLSATEVVTELFNVTVNDGNGISVLSTLTITINGENDLPVPANDTNSTVETLVVNEADGSGNLLSNDSDPDGDVLTIFSVNGSTADITTGLYGTLAWNSDGTYTYSPNARLDSLHAGETLIELFTLVIRDQNGGESSTTLTITITGENDLPIANNDTNSTVGNAVVNETDGSGNLLANDIDPDNDPLLVANVNGSTARTVIGTYGTLTWNPNGTYTYTPNSAMDSLTAGESVNEIFTVSISDGNGGSDNSSLTIIISGEVINHPPVAVADFLTITEDKKNNLINVLINDSDPDGDGLSISIISGPISGGTVNFSQGQIVYNPPMDYFGNDYFVYEICDNGIPVLCDIDTVFITVTPVNDAPIAVTDNVAIFVNPDAPITIDVQANDFDVEGNSLFTTIISGSTQGGIVSVSNGDQVTYLPPVDFIGTDTVIYQICDNGKPSLCDIDTIFIRVVDQLLAIDDLYEMYAGETDTFDILDNDLFIGDVDVTLIGQPDHGTVILNSDETITYIANDNYTGNDTISYQISDGNSTDMAIVVILIKPIVELKVVADCDGELASIEWNVKLLGTTATSIDIKMYDANNALVKFIDNASLSGGVSWPGAHLAENGYAFNVAPNLQQLRVVAEYNLNPFLEIGTQTVIFPHCHSNIVIAEADTATIILPVQIVDVLGNDYDPDEGEIDLSSLAVSISPRHGVVNVNPNGTITYIPNVRFSGIDSFTYVICDDIKPETACDTALVRLNVVWDDKLIAYDDNYWTYENTPKVLPVTSNDFDPDNTLDWQSLTILTSPTHGTAIKGNNGTVTYTPNTEFVGRDSFYYQICNSRVPAECDQAWAYVDVVENRQLVAVYDEAGTNAEESILIDVLINDTDPEGLIDTLSLAIVDLPDHGAVTILTEGIISYTPADNFTGIDSFIYKICDSGLPQTCDTAVVRINVLDNNLALVANPDYGVTNENNLVEIKLLANDIDPDGIIDVSTLRITVQPQHGTISVLPGGVVSYLPSVGFFGNDSFIYQICDDGPIVKCDTALVIIRVVDNLPPVAMNDTITIYGGNTTEWKILSNDYDPEGQLDSTSIEVIRSTSNGTVVIAENGSIEFTPTNCYYGSDRITYRIYDLQGKVSNTAEVVINVVMNMAADSDNDGVANAIEDINRNGNPCDDDTDSDLIPDYIDNDDDGDGVLTKSEDWNLNDDPTDDDADHDGKSNYLDSDDDDDSILTINEDVDGNGDYLNDDTDNDTLPNFLDSDDDGDSYYTIDETGDLDENGMADYLEVWSSSAITDYLSIAIEERVTIPVLANDSSQMMESTLHIVQDPLHGFVSVDQTDWTIIYSPEANYTGIDSFIYAVCDYYNICDTAYVIINISDKLNFPELFTPNGDGTNDYYVIDGIEKYPNNQFVVYNRWGNKVYDKVGYANEWNGWANVKFVIGSKELPDGVYYYILRFNGDKERAGALFLGR